MTTWIIFALLIFFVQTMLPSLFRFFLRSDPQIFAPLGSRDELPETSRFGARAERAMYNSIEQYTMFIPLSLLTLSSEQALLGAQIFVLSRAAYVPVYILGIPVLRSLIWAIGVFGLVQMGLVALG